MNRRHFIFFCCVLLQLSASATTYEVGPQEKFSSIGEVPWESLEAGDKVLIHWRPDAYKEKWVICRQGTEAAPIVVRGVPGPKGELPVIDGDGATTRNALKYWGDIRGVIKIGGANHPIDTMPEHIVLENLDIRHGRAPFAFTTSEGTEKKYSPFAAAIYVEKARHLTIRNCVIHDNGDGLFVSSNDDRASEDILVEGNYIYDNGVPASGGEHNVYTAAIGITFQFNHFGPLKEKSLGNNLKDRSAGTVIRYNWIESGNNVLDLVQGVDSKLIRKHPLYAKTMVYGNVITKPNGPIHGYIVHFGGESTYPKENRQGTLYFYNNTVIADRKIGSILFRLSDAQEKVDCRNNILFTRSGSKPMQMMFDKGDVQFSHNWISYGWTPCATPKSSYIFKDDGTSITRGSPQFVDEKAGNFYLLPDSLCVNAGTGLSRDILPDHDVTREYLKHQNSRNRAKDGKLDMGAFEFSR